MAAGSPSDHPLSAKAQRLAREWAQDPQSKVFVPLAEEYAKLGMLQRAAMVLEEGIGTYPGYVIAMVALGSVYYEMKEVASAKDVLQAAIASSPENMKAHRVLAQIYAGEGNIEAARRSCTVVLMTNPLDEEIKTLEATLGKPQPAEEPTKPSHQSPVSDSVASGALTDEPASCPEFERQPTGDPMSGVTTTPSAAEAFPPVSPHAKKIERLEAWLTQIRTARRTA